MQNKPLQVLMSVLFALLAANTAASSDFVNAPAPDFALRGIDGKTLRLSEYRSEIVLLNFASESCARCREAMPVLQELQRQHRAEGLNVIAVDIDGDPEAAARLAAGLDPDFTVLLDTGQSVSRLYDLGRLPLTLLIDREGVVRFVNEGFRGDSGAQVGAEVARLLAD
jgi:peroxiredoxin